MHLQQDGHAFLNQDRDFCLKQGTHFASAKPSKTQSFSFNTAWCAILYDQSLHFK